MSYPFCPTCGLSFEEGNIFCPHDGSILRNPLSDDNDAEEGEGSLTPGQQVEQYQVEKKIGAGGMGEVWLAKHPQIGKKVAIKVLNERSAKNPKSASRFMGEARAVNEIQSRHIVDIFSFGKLPNKRPYFIMEYLEGKSLTDYLEQQGPLSFQTILYLLKPICRALQAAHDRGIVHRDLKPDNVFLVLEPDEPPLVKLLDFGIAKLMGDGISEAQSLTKSGAIFGTPTYMSPEQCEGTKHVDHRSDIYSIGIILFEMICGQTPFYTPGDGIGLVISRHILTPTPTPSSFLPTRNIPKEVDIFLVERVLAKDPEKRPAQCSIFYKELQKLLQTFLEGSVSPVQKNPVDLSIATSNTVPYQPTVIKHKTEQTQSLPEDYYASTTASQDLQQIRPSRKMRNILLGAGSGIFLLLAFFSVYHFWPTPTQELIKPSSIDAPALAQSSPLSKTTSKVPTTLRKTDTLPASTLVSTPPQQVPLEITTTPKNAKLFLDDVYLGTTPFSKKFRMRRKNRNCGL